MVMTSSVSAQPLVDAKLKLYYVAAPRQVTFTDTVEDDGIDNPFRPGGGLSREADIIVQMIKAGKPITPTSPTREDIRELGEDLKRRQQKEDQHQDELERCEDSFANDVTPHTAPNGVGTRVDHMTNGGPPANGNNNMSISSKPASPRTSAGGSGGKSAAAPENSPQDTNSLKKNTKRSCCAVQ